MTTVSGRNEAERTLGAAVLASLEARHLLRRISAPGRLVVPGEGEDRVAAAISGLALGDALAAWSRSIHYGVRGSADVRRWLGVAEAARVTATTQGFVLSAEVWCAPGWSAPVQLSDRLAARAGNMRHPGRAVRTAVAARRAGAPWFEAASGSYGDALLSRSVAVGLVRTGAAGDLGLAASLDAAVTHASSRATAASAALAGIVAALVQRPTGQSPRECMLHVVDTVDHRPLRTLLQAALAPTEVPPTGSPDHGVRPHAFDVLALAVWCALLSDEPDSVLATAVEYSGGSRSAVAVTGALFGAIQGAAALPARAGSVEGAEAYAVLAQRIAAGLVPRAGDGSGADIWFLLDRSGSMGSIAREVVVGFDRFFAEQREVAGGATVTVVQFDDKDPHDVIVDARPVAEVRSIAGRFEPRGMTPLYDALGQLLDRVEAHGGDDADQLVVVMTDGMENASRRWDQPALFRRIGDLRDRGWTFVFLGANQDSYAAGGALGVDAGNVSNFRPDAVGLAATYDGLSRTVTEWRGKDRARRLRDRDDFWDGRKEAEEV
jgi:ADP-ribosylglycohydrolase